MDSCFTQIQKVMMQLVYSVFSEADSKSQTDVSMNLQQADSDIILRFMAHQEVCNRYREEIAAIRKYLPQWQPVFNIE